jgi:hypothetical protein
MPFTLLKFLIYHGCSLNIDHFIISKIKNIIFSFIFVLKSQKCKLLVKLDPYKKTINILLDN